MSLKTKSVTASEIFQRFLHGKGFTERPSCRRGFMEIWPAAHRGDEVWLLDQAEYKKLRDLLSQKLRTCPVKQEGGSVCGKPAFFVDTVLGAFVCQTHISERTAQLRREMQKEQAA